MTTSTPDPGSAGPGLLRIDLRAHGAWYGDRQLTLTRMEYRLLVELARHAGAVLTKEELLANVWGHPGYEGTTVSMHVSTLRRKLGDHNGQIVRTVRGVGYMLAADSLAHPIAEPAPAGTREPTLSPQELLHDSIANLRAYIEQRAGELAAPHIAAAGVAAGEEVAAARRAQERAEDLVAELRRQVTLLERQLEQARAAVPGRG